LNAFLKRLREDQKIESDYSILRPDITKVFMALYALAKGELDDAQGKSFIEDMTGQPYPHSAVVKEDLKGYFQLMQTALEQLIVKEKDADIKKRFETDRVLIIALQPVLDNPEKFPLVDEIEKTLVLIQLLQTMPEYSLEDSKNNILSRIDESILAVRGDYFEKDSQDLKTSLTGLVDLLTDHSEEVSISKFDDMVESEIKPFAKFIRNGLKVSHMSEVKSNPGGKCIVFDEEVLSASQETDKQPSFEQTIVIPPPNVLNKPIVDDVTDFVLRKEKGEKERALVKEKALALQDVFSFTTGDDFVDRFFSSIKAGIRNYSAKHHENLQGYYEVKSLEKFANLQADLQQLRLGVLQDLSHERQKVLSFANKVPDNTIMMAQQLMQTGGKGKKMLSMDDILKLFVNPDMDAFRQANPALSREEIASFGQHIASYLVLGSLEQHLSHLSDQIENIQQMVTDKAPRSDLNEQLRSFVEAAETTRKYDVAEHPEYLVLEYVLGIILRADQVENLDKLKVSGGVFPYSVALEAIMGSGKTSVLTPLMQLFHADGKNAAVVVMPDALMTSMATELEERSGKSFGQNLQVMTFSRSSDLDEAGLENILYRLKDIQEKKQILLMGNRSVQSLYLQFVEKFHAGNKKEIALFLQIMTFLRKSGVATIDEVDFILNVLHSHHFTLGQSHSLDEAVSNTVVDLYSILASTPEIARQINLQFLEGKGDHPFTDDFYHAEVKPLLVREILERGVWVENPEVGAFFQNMDEGDRKLLGGFLVNTNDPACYRFISAIGSDEIKNLLSVLKEQLNNLLPLTLKKNLGEHYGPDIVDEKVIDKHLLAIPYHQSKPSLGAQFGTEMEIMNYAIQMHLINGISANIVKMEIERLQVQAKKESSNTRSIEKSESFQALLKMCSVDENIIPLNITEEDVVKITEAVNKDLVAKMALIKRYVLSQIRVYNSQLDADAQTFAIMFNRLLGFSGTLWNTDTFPKAFEVFYLSDTERKTLSLLWERSPHNIKVLKGDALGYGAKERLKKLYEDSSIPAGSLIDAAGDFSDLPSHEVAKLLLAVQRDRDTSIKGVIYYDIDDNLVVLEEGVSEAKLLSKSLLTKEDVIAYWDQKHTTGSDIELSGTMKASLTVSRHTLLRDFMQAVWRLRGIHNGQRVNFVVLEEDEKVIRGVLEKIYGEAFEGPLELKHLLVYVVYNQCDRRGKDNYRALKQKLKGVLLEKVLDVMTNPKTSVGDAEKLFQATEELFVTKTVQTPYQLYGRQQKIQDSAEVIEQEVNNIINSQAMKAFHSFPKLREKYKTEEIVNELKSLAEAELEKLPAELMHDDSYGRERSMEIEQEVDKELEKELDKDLDLDKVPESVCHISLHDMKEWDSERLFSKEYLTDASPLMEIGKIFEYMGWEKLLGLFDKKLQVSSNLVLELSPFDPAQLDAASLLVIEDKDSGEITTGLLDLRDTAAVEAILAKDSKEPIEGPREVRLALYNLTTGIFRQGSERIDESVLEKNEEFQRYKLQAKFFSGEVDYPENEVLLLKRWIGQQKDIKGLRKIFMDKVLSNKSLEKKAFDDSVIGKIFKELD